MKLKRYTLQFNSAIPDSQGVWIKYEEYKREYNHMERKLKKLIKLNKESTKK